MYIFPESSDEYPGTINQPIEMEKSYKPPSATRIGHVHLKVSDLNRALEFYRDLLGFELDNDVWGSGCFSFSRRVPSSCRAKHLA